MKKILIFLVFLQLAITTCSQVQRLATLPSTMKLFDEAGSTLIPSICLDFFRETPGFSGSADVYNHFQRIDGSMPNNLVGKNIEADTYTSIRIPDENGITTQPILLSATDDLSQLSSKYKEFISIKIQEYNKPGFDDFQLSLLQAEIWSYDILQTLGYIDDNLRTLQAYENGATKFAADFFGLTRSADPLEITSVGMKFSKLKGENQLLILKTNTGDYMAFQRLAPPIYKGNSESELVNEVANLFPETEILSVGLENFESSRESAFLVDFTRKINRTRTTELIITTGDAETLSIPSSYKVITDYADESIETIIEGENSKHYSSIMVESEELGEMSLIEAVSNKRNSISTFFKMLSETIRQTTEQFVLYRLNKRIKNQVMKDMQFTNEDFLDVIISDESGHKVLVQIKNKKFQFTNGYAKH